MSTFILSDVAREIQAVLGRDHIVVADMNERHSRDGVRVGYSLAVYLPKPEWIQVTCILDDGSEDGAQYVIRRAREWLEVGESLQDVGLPLATCPHCGLATCRDIEDPSGCWAAPVETAEQRDDAREQYEEAQYAARVRAGFASAEGEES